METEKKKKKNTARIGAQMKECMQWKLSLMLKILFSFETILLLLLLLFVGFYFSLKANAFQLNIAGRCKTRYTTTTTEKWAEKKTEWKKRRTKNVGCSLQ